MTRRPSLRAAIDHKCKSCIYDPGSRGLGTWREQVEGCSSTNCPLWPVRPTSKAVKAANEAEDDYGEPDPTDEPEESVASILGGVFGREGHTAGQ